MSNPLPERCPSCAAKVASPLFNPGGLPAIWICLDCDEPVVLCEACMKAHAREVHGRTGPLVSQITRIVGE